MDKCIFLYKTDVDKAFLWGHNLTLEKGNKLQYIAIHLNHTKCFMAYSRANRLCQVSYLVSISILGSLSTATYVIKH